MLSRPADSALPDDAVIGKVTYDSLTGTVDVTSEIRTFNWQAEAPGGDGATFSDASVVQSAIGHSPNIMQALALGRHLPTVTVVIYRESSTTPFQQFVFSDVLLSLDKQVRNAPSATTGLETVAWNYRTIRQTTFKADGKTVLHTACFDIATRTAC